MQIKGDWPIDLKAEIVEERLRLTSPTGNYIELEKEWFKDSSIGDRLMQEYEIMSVPYWGGEHTMIEVTISEMQELKEIVEYYAQDTLEIL